MAERVTMREIAERTGVSVNTVHKALTGKPGVSDAMRKRIMDCAEQLGYRRNANASNLRRTKIRVAVVVPSPEGEGRYYYSYLWRGIEAYEETAESVLIFEGRPYPTGGYGTALEQLIQDMKEGLHIDGMLAYAPSDGHALELLSSLGAQGIPIELLDGDQEIPGRLGCMVADYATAGRLMAEQAANILPEAAQEILVLGGDRQVRSHAEVLEGFSEGLQEIAPQHRIETLFGAHGKIEELSRAVRAALADEEPALACSVFAVGTEVLCQALDEEGLAGRLPVIGNDLFPESVHALLCGTLTNAIYKDPVGLAHQAMDALCSHLLSGGEQPEPLRRGNVEMVFRSNLPQYCRLMGIPFE